MTSHADARILVAEPDDTIRLFLTDNLAADGYEVQAVADRDAALDELVDGDPDLIVVDVNGDTLALLDALRSGQAPKGAVPADCPAIALTSHADELHRVRLLERGADDVVAKPFSYPELRGFSSSLRAGAKNRLSSHREAGPPYSPVKTARRRRPGWSGWSVRDEKSPLGGQTTKRAQGALASWARCCARWMGGSAGCGA
jgi:DNA-binding response OmpR family regulator